MNRRVYRRVLVKVSNTTMMVNIFLLAISSAFPCLNGFIVPDEVPSLLSVIYSNIPTIKKGTDSRIGWGFRLGNRADFQVLVELGPQTYTQPLANQPGGGGSSSGGTNKRDNPDTLANVLYAQRQHEKAPDYVSDTDGGKWLQNWGAAMNGRNTQTPKSKPGLAVGEIDAKSVIPADEDDDSESQNNINTKNDTVNNGDLK